MSAKSLDKKNRFRSKTIGFRVSPEEWEDIERLVRLSGMSKQDYIMHRLQNKEMIIQANPRVVKVLKYEILELCKLVKNISNTETYNEVDEILHNLFLIAK